MAVAPKFDQDMREYLEGQAGTLVMLSDDQLFMRALRTAIFKTLGIKTDCLQVYQDQAHALKTVHDRLNRKLPVLVLADRLLHGKPNLEFLRTVKMTFSEAKLLVMTQETSKADLSQLYELGVDSIVTKPVSIDTLVEKMAGAIKPQGRISQLVQEARACLEQGDTAKVKQIAQEILRLKEKSPVACMLLGDAFLAEDRRDEAIRSYEAAHVGARLYLEPLKKLADAHKELDEDAYLRYLRKLDVISPLNTERKCEIGKVYVRRNEMEHADTYFSAAISTAQREAFNQVDRIVQEIAEVVAEASPDLAEKYFVQLLNMKGDNLTIDDMVTFNKLGIALRRQGKWRDAVDNYKKALTVSPTDERILYNMGLAYADGQLHRMAVTAYEQVQRIAPEFHKTAPMVAFNMASAFAMVKDIPNARYYLSAALKLDPSHASSRRLLARLDQLGV